MTQTVNLKLRQGEDGGFTFRILEGEVALDLSSGRAKLQVRKTARTEGEPLLELTHLPGGGIALGGTTGVVSLRGKSTRSLPPGMYEHDLFVEVGERTYVPAAGKFELLDAVTELGDWDAR